MVGLDVTPVAWLLVTVRTRYVGSRYLVNDVEHTHARMPDYAVTDVGARVQTGPVRAWVTVFNVLNRMYCDNGALGGGPFGSREAFNPAPGINVETGMQVEF
jgi:hypothetical protein